MTDELSASLGPSTSHADTIGSAQGEHDEPDAALPLARGSTIGRYVVLARLGAGGMGVVFAAYDPELDRKVAIKLLKTGSGSQAARTRLQREAQALAKLDHDNVVSVFDVGVHEGQLFMSMEFVEGRTLGRWLAERPRPWREVLPIFIAAGRGLAAAHAAGLVHRDFKPDNVMIAREGRVRVMDFGLARAEGEPLVLSHADLATKQLLGSPLTMTGTLLGTPAYMAPEQLSKGSADALSDQFGFCVALYEALYGERPFPGSTLGSLLAAIETGTLQAVPRARKVPSWLRAVVVRGLEYAPERRWASMHELLAALAADPTLVRRRWLVQLGLVGLVGAGAWASMQLGTREPTAAGTCTGFEDHLVGVWDEARAAEVDAAIRATGLGHAPDTATRVRTRLDTYAREWVAAREHACAATQRGEQSDELLDRRMRCLDERLRHVRVAVDLLAAADATVAGEAVPLVAALPRLERCADTHALMAAIPGPDDAALAERVATLAGVLIDAEALEKAGKYDEGLAKVEAVLREADTLGYEPLEVRARLRTGLLQISAGDLAEAEASLQHTFGAALGLGMIDEAARASGELVKLVGHDLARHAEGRRWALDAEPLARLIGTDEALSLYQSNIGAVALAQGEHDEAREHYELALQLRERVYGPEHPLVASTLNNLGAVASMRGDNAAAKTYHQRALRLRELAFGPEHPEVASSLHNLAVVAIEQGELDEAEAYSERSLAIRERTLGPDHVRVAAALHNLGCLLVSRGKFEAARIDLERARAIRERELGPEHPKLADTLTWLGILASNEGDQDGARVHLARALAINEKQFGERPQLLHVLVVLAQVEQRAGDFASARTLLERARAITREAGDQARDTSMVLYGRGRLALAEGKLDEAHEQLELALTMLEQQSLPEWQAIVDTRTQLGHTLLERGELDAARTTLERALQLGSDHALLPGTLARTRFALARVIAALPVERGGDPARSRELVALAQADVELVSDVVEAEQLRADIEAWQRAQ